MKTQKRKLAEVRCKIFVCKESKFAWQCCNFCEKADNCQSKCLNHHRKCGYLHIGTKYKRTMAAMGISMNELKQFDEYMKGKRKRV